MSFISTHLDVIIMAIIVVILGFKQLSSGTSSINKEIIATYKERLDQLEVKIRDVEEKYNESKSDNAALRATLVEKDKHIASLTALNQGKNPEIVTLLKEMSKSNIEVITFMKIMHTVLVDSKKEMRYQTGMLEKGENRNTAIDKASKTHEGEPVLIPKKHNESTA